MRTKRKATLPEWASDDWKAHALTLYVETHHGGRCEFDKSQSTCSLLADCYTCPHWYDNHIAKDREAVIEQHQETKRLEREEWILQSSMAPHKAGFGQHFDSLARDIFHADQPLFYVIGESVDLIPPVPSVVRVARVRISSTRQIIRVPLPPILSRSTKKRLRRLGLPSNEQGYIQRAVGLYHKRQAELTRPLKIK